MAKAEEAKKMYDSDLVPPFLVKEKYVELKAFLGPTFVVLRDGSVEDNTSDFKNEQQHEMQAKIGKNLV